MSTGQIRLFAYSEANYAAKASLLKALDPTSAVTVEKLKFWDRWWDPKYRRETFLVEIDDQPVALGGWLWWYEPGRYLVELDIHPAFSHHRQVHNGVVQYGRDLCRT
jgi:hypothetical protein